MITKLQQREGVGAVKMPKSQKPSPPPYTLNVPRCQHVKINGAQCGSPALSRQTLCFFHKRFQEEKITLIDRERRHLSSFDLPVIEDAESIQMVVMEISRQILSRQMDAKTAGVLLYAMQIASCNLRMAQFAPPAPSDIVVDFEEVVETCLTGQQPSKENSVLRPEPPAPKIAASTPVHQAAALATLPVHCKPESQPLDQDKKDAESCEFPAPDRNPGVRPPDPPRKPVESEHFSNWRARIDA
jgi:hypothetical protein